MDISLLLSYIFLGFTLAAPIGPVNSARLDMGIKNGFWHAWIVGLGSMIADGIFMCIIYLGFANFINIEIVQIFLWLFGAFVLIYSGVEGMYKARSFMFHYSRKKDSLLKCFFTGFLLSISSPLSILFWLGIYGSMLAKTVSQFGGDHLLLYSSMIFCGLAIWDIFVAALTTVFRMYLTSRSLQWISIISGLSLVAFGIYFGWQGISSL
ncbi:LysE family translocator [Caldibacillus lycopersici]|uniref:LysE family translocator n=1 Tax=Perspicuibacillus lycopersici TaxID=1325689 RepID=A0AAE3IPW7_9BACI|nr:LysE family translocator [Perspicuibacillus lycopersici]MCU9612032.1 LysE family translocator [Perspicuibacillus lycopersici]